MVDFIRDVVIVLAVLVTLLAFALNPGGDSDSTKKAIESPAPRLVDPPVNRSAPADTTTAPRPQPVSY